MQERSASQQHAPHAARMMAHLSAAGLMIRISTSQPWCRWWWSHRFGPRFHGSLVGGDVGRRMVLGKMSAPFRSPTPSCYLHARNSTVADWRAHLDMGVHNQPGLQEAHPTHQWPVRLCDCSRQHAIREKFQSSIFHQWLAGMASDGVFLHRCCPASRGANSVLLRTKTFRQSRTSPHFT